MKCERIHEHLVHYNCRMTCVSYDVCLSHISFALDSCFLSTIDVVNDDIELWSIDETSHVETAHLKCVINRWLCLYAYFCFCAIVRKKNQINSISSQFATHSLHSHANAKWLFLEWPTSKPRKRNRKQKSNDWPTLVRSFEWNWFFVIARCIAEIPHVRLASFALNFPFSLFLRVSFKRTNENHIHISKENVYL